eukprot:2698729-Heterocapsa_arctica.AAC.1
MEDLMKGIINFETQPQVSSDFKQTDYYHSVDAALTMIIGAKTGRKTDKETANSALKVAVEDPMKGIINFETQRLVSNDFKQTDYSNPVDAALTMVMGEDL